MNQLGQPATTLNSTSGVSLPGQNLLLRLASADILDALSPHLEYLDMPVPYSLHDASVPIEFAYFLNSGVGSLVSEFADGSSVEIGIVGKEGFWGGSLLAGVDVVRSRSFMQIGGDGFRMPKSAFLELVERNRPFENLLQRALYLEQVQSRQLAACNVRHEVAERLARWLLMCDDRVQSQHLNLTHEFLALMLGTRRSTVTLAAGALQQAGLIRYTRRVIHIIDRAQLEQAACQCYSIIADEYERVIGLAPHRREPS